jgi:hypothetical protein
MRASRTYPLALALAALVGLASARACSIPVFRYALERWPSAPYDVVVFHRGPLAESDRALLRRLTEPVPPANVSVTTVDLADDPSPDARQLWQTCAAGARLPWLVVRLPDPDNTSRPLFAGPLTEATVEAVLGSPARRQLARRLTAGESVVFVLLTGDDSAADAAAARLLDRELPRLQGSARLPEPSADGPQLLSALPLKAEFTSLRLSRHDPREQVLIRALLHSGDDLDRVAGPIVFPVFGRGRALDGLHGRKLTAAGLEQELAFLCGACSCTVKELNPGLDLLMAAAWNDRLGIVPPSPDPAPWTTPEPPTEVPPAPGPDAAAAAVLTPTAPPPARPDWLRLAIAGAAGLAVVTGVWAWRSRPRRV